MMISAIPPPIRREDCRLRRNVGHTFLLNLAPDIQEAILFLPRAQRGRDLIILRDLQLIAVLLDWRHQRQMWRRLSTD
jgi:hypothetical protein